MLSNQRTAGGFDRRRACAAAVILVGALPAVAGAQSPGSVHPEPPPEVRAVPLTEPITLDGRLDEEVWRTAPAATDFRQSEPEEGAPATQRTEVRFAYDNVALYIGARMYDDRGAAGVRSRLVRRDGNTDGDELILVFDTYHDHLGRAEFRVQPSGSMGDALGPGNSSLDPSWDPVWTAATHIDSLGWTAELRIPLSQLSFSREVEQTWGLQIVRMVSRLNERSHWVFWRLNESGGPARYGHLTGLRIEERPRGLEVMPYLVGRSAFIEPAAGNPFQEARSGELRVGGDFRYRLTSNLTLSGTINPDFGQVEVDPAVVNLSAFETFFPEKRPFFVEGAGLFSFGGLSCYFCSNISSLNVFYSRRVGRPPEAASLARDAGEYADVPANTTILGAAKVTGRTSGGWTVAFMDAVTRREHARVAAGDGSIFTREVAPLSNFFLGRVKRDLRGGNLVVGGVLSSLYRDFDDPDVAGLLTRRAEVAGVDADLRWSRRTYRLMASLAVSNVTGEPDAIRRIQESSAHYFQRPDRDGRSGGLFPDAYDPARTSLRGYGVYARVAKEAGDWLWDAMTSIRSPGFETNDVAFLNTADFVWMNGSVFRRFTKPTRYYRYLDLIAGAQQQFNYDGDLTDREYNFYVGSQLPNYWEWSAFHIHMADVMDDRLTRGGPVVERRGGGYWSFYLATDSRRSIVLSTNPNYYRGRDGTRDWRVGVTAIYRPAPNLSLSLGPTIQHSESSHQYIGSWEDPTATAWHGRRYLFADLEQRTLSMDTRLNVTFTPTLSLELFAQPLISGARFSRFKEFAAPRGSAMRVFGEDFGTLEIEETDTGQTYTVDADGAAGPAPAYTFRDPDFNFRSLRGNAVFRWEYRPGSTLYLVWTQDRNDTAAYGDVRLRRDGGELFRARPDNIFLVKVSYWLGL